MKVKELIEELQKCDQEKEVIIIRHMNDDSWYASPKIIKTETCIYFI